MKIRDFLIASGLFLGVTFLFFYPVFLRGHLPFPGDLLVGNYAPWNSYSFLGYAPGGIPHKAQGIDVARELFPWKHFSIETLRKGELPLWNPYNISGSPHLANFQSGVFYPLNFIFFLLPFNLAWVVFIFLQPFFACCFTYLLARELKISRLGGLLAGLAFAFCLYFTVWIEYGNVGHSLLWLPLALFLSEKIVKEKRATKWAISLIFILALSLFAGYIQTTVYLFGTTLVFFLFRLISKVGLKKKEGRFKLALFSGSLIFPFFLAAPQLLPTLELFSQSARQAYPPEEITKLLLPWFYPITTFAADFFGNPASRNYWYPGTYIERVSYLGVLPLFFAFLALVGRRREKIVLFFAGLAVASLLLTLNLPPIRFFYALKIPIISTTVYTRLLSLFSFSLAILAGFGVDFWLKTKKKRSLLMPLVIFSGVYVLLWLFTFFAPIIFPSAPWLINLGVSQRNLFLPTVFFLVGAFLLVISFWLPKRLLFWGLAALIIFDLFFYFHKITPFSPTEFVYPQTEIMKFLQENAGINRFWGYGTAYIDSNFSTFSQTYSTDGYDPLFIRRYGELISSSDDGKIKDPIPRSDVALAGGYGRGVFQENPHRQRLLNLLGVKYVLNKDESLGEGWRPESDTFPDEIYQLIWQEGSWQVYENKAALPRLFLVGEYQVEGEKQKIVDLILDPEFPLEEKVVLEESLPSELVVDKDALGKIEALDYQPNRVKFQVDASGNGLLFISDNFYPGWKAEIDGQETKIYRANYTFRSIFIPQGKHQVLFYYRPESFKWGLLLSLLSLGVIIIVAVTAFNDEKRRS